MIKDSFGVMALGALGAIGALAAPLAAKDSLGVYARWASFRDAQTPRCYAISAPQTEEATSGYASVGTWPAHKVTGQVHFKLSQVPAQNATVRLSVGRERFDLSVQGRDAWAKDKAMDAAVIAAMRAAQMMSVRSRDASGKVFTDRYPLEGAATAMDAALLGCAKLR